MEVLLKEENKEEQRKRKMNFIDAIFFFYTFIGLYMIALMMIVYFPHRKEMFDYPKGNQNQ